MSTRRLIASLTVSAAALALAATFAVRSFPLEAQGQPPTDTKEPIQLVRGGDNLLHGELPEYPKRAIDRKVEGDVVVEMTLNDRGEVSDARVVSGPDELRRATLEAVLQWHYSPTAMSSTSTQATLRFKVPANFEEIEAHGKVFMEGARIQGRTIEVTTKPEKYEADHLQVYDVELKAGHKLSSRTLNWKLYEAHLEPKFDGTAQLLEVKTERVPEATAREVLAQAGVNVGDAITEEAAKRIRQAAETMDEHFRVEFRQDKKAGGVIVTILTR